MSIETIQKSRDSNMSISIIDTSDDFIQFAKQILVKYQFGKFTQYYYHLKTLKMELVKILKNIYRNKQYSIIQTYLLELLKLRDTFFDFISEFDIDNSTLNAYFITIKDDCFTITTDSIVSEIEKEWFIRIKKFDIYYDYEKTKYDTQFEKIVLKPKGILGWLKDTLSLTSSSKKHTSHSRAITTQNIDISSEESKPEEEHDDPEDSEDSDSEYELREINEEEDPELKAIYDDNSRKIYCKHISNTIHQNYNKGEYYPNKHIINDYDREEVVNYMKETLVFLGGFPDCKMTYF
jgi:hypothetical protein